MSRMLGIVASIKEKLKHPGLLKYGNNASWLFWGRIFSLFISFFVSIYVARYLGPQNYGLLSFAISFVGLFSFITNLGVDQIFARDLLKYPEKEKELLGTTFLLKLAGGIVSFLLSLFFIIFLEKDFLTISIVAIIAVSSLFQPMQILIGYYQCKVASKYPAIITLTIVFLLSVLKLWIIFLNKGVYYFSFIFALESILYALFLGYIFVKKEYPLTLWRFEKKLAVGLLQDSWPLMLTGAFALIYTRIDQIIIKQLMEQMSVGIYSAGVSIAEAWYFIPGIFTASFLPAIINAQKTNADSYKRRLLYLNSFLVGMSILIASIIFVFAGPIIHILYGEAYLNSVAVLKIYVWAGVAITLWGGLTQYLIAENEKFIVFFASLLGMVVNVILNFVLIPKYGINGAAFATLCSYFLLPFSVLFFKRTRDDILLILKSHK